ncbi:MAG: Holliday junction branch migration DNA helicase RuvB [Candidatus Yanofskybacteria bacterium]|nr:Holliday junction branch migration DNA helicase RuvB [Candidatus Yanofskybacteria bacterium]
MPVKSPNDWDINLRPTSWDEYVGQEKVKNNLRISIDAAKKRGGTLEHVLFYGGSGLGKTSLAGIIAQEMGATLRTCAGPSMEKTGDLASLLTNLEEGDILFVDECHRIPKIVMESLYSALEDYTLHLILGRGPMARTMELRIPHFMLIGATTRLSLLPAPFRNRFGSIFQFSFYSQGEIEKILARSAQLLGAPIDPAAIRMIASRSRATPRIANRILKRVRDFALIQGNGTISPDTTERAFAFFEIDSWGLEQADRKLLEILMTTFKGGPAGIQALAAAMNEDQETVLDVLEPYLLQLGLVERTPKGRVATPLAYKHMGARAQDKMV